METVVNFYGPERRLIAAQLELGRIRKSWVNPALVESEDFQGLAHAQEQLHNGCSPKMRAFYEKLTKLYCFDLGVSYQEPERLAQEIESFRRGFNVWV
jgi:hypothetical protein